MRPKPLRTLTVLLAAAIFVPPASAAVLSCAGTHTNLGSGWRTSAVAKPLDADADSVLGTDGYHLVNRPPVLPAYVSQTTILTSTYPGNGGYALMDDPVAMPAVFTAGTMNPHPGPGVSADLFRFTLNTNAVGRTIRVGLLVDNLDIASFNASSLSLVQTNSPGATSGPVATGSAAFNDRIPDWVFFDITDAAAGDTFIVRGVGGASSTAALGGVSFDSLGTVINTADSGPGSLRAVVAASSPGATITFATNLSGQTITLTSEVLLDKSLVLDASALPGGVTISGNHTTRFFNLGASGNVTLVGLTFTGGNVGGGAGGAIYSAGGSSLRIVRCTFSSNNGNEGGAILNDGSLLVENSTFSGNNGGFGGALQCRNLTTLTHCTFSGNDAYYGGGIYNNSTTLTINNSMIVGNTAGGGIRDILNQSAALVFTNANLVQSITASTAAAPITGPAPLANAPLLAVLGNYGGPTPTMPPLAGSPAIDAGGATALTTDQRGSPRVIGAAADLGAVEFYTTNAVVTTNADAIMGSLRYAIAHSRPEGTSTITFATNLSGQTLVLSQGQLRLDRNLVLDASALPGGFQINANRASRIFSVESNATVVLKSLLLTNGLAAGAAGTNGTASGPFGSSGAPGLGGGIYNAGLLTLDQVTLVGSAAVGGLAGISFNEGKHGDNAPVLGGGIYNAGALTLHRSMLAGNSASAPDAVQVNFSYPYGGGDGLGGGIYNAGTLTLNQATLAEASAQGGAGGTSGNSGGSGGAAQGGAIYNAGLLNVNQSTLTANAATNGIGGTGPNPGSPGASQAGGIYGFNTVALFNTIVAGNFALSDTNLFGAFSATGSNLTNGTALLAPVGNYGGPTPTRPPLTGSPALDAGSDVATNAFATDQRGLPRRSGQHVDIGAVELVLGAPAITALSATVIGTNPATGVFSVQLSASVNPNSELSTTVHFQYGLTASYAGTSGPLFVPAIDTPIQPTNLTVVLGLNSGFTYHWWAVAANSVGTNATPDQTFHLTAPGLPGDTNGDGMVSQSELDAVYASYLPTSPWLALTNVAGLGGTNVTFALEGSPLGAYTVDYSTNLADWFPLGPATPRYGFTDTNAPALPQRHYRLRYP